MPRQSGKCHLDDFVSAYNFGRRLTTLKGFTPYEFICKRWTSEPERFRLDPIHQMPGLNICEQAHQQLKEELGFDHFEGRSWTGLHRHALMTMIAYAFLQSRRLKQAKREKKNPGPAASADLASGPRGHHRGLRRATINTMSALPPLAQL